MDHQRLYALSCQAAREVLEGLQNANLERVTRNLSRISHYVALAETVPAESLSGSALYRREQLELLGGITENLSGALSAVRENLADRLQTLSAHQSLLRHVTAAAPTARCA